MHGSSTRIVLLVALAALDTLVGCGSATPVITPTPTANAPASATTTASVPPPFDCDTLCTKANTVAGCATPPENVPACVDLCKRMLEGACKAQVEAELACAAKITLACKPEGTVDWGACVAEQRAANECAKTAL